jgi:hypothetical protein
MPVCEGRPLISGGVDLGAETPYLQDIGAISAARKICNPGETDMTSFQDRERGEEARFAHDAELRFKAEVRRNKLLGFWAAELMGLTELEGRQAYAEEVIASDFVEAGDEDVFRKISADLTAKGVVVDEAAIRRKMAELVPVAREQVLAEG